VVQKVTSFVFVHLKKFFFSSEIKKIMYPLENMVFENSSSWRKIKMTWRKLLRLIKGVQWKKEITAAVKPPKTVIPPVYQIETVIKWIESSRTIYFFTGAGMSAGSGVPTFRGRFGLWRLGIHFFVYSLVLFAICSAITIYFRWSKLFLPLFGILFVASFILPVIGGVALSTPWGWEKYPKISWVIFKLFFFDNIATAKLNKGHMFMKYLGEVYKKSVEVITSNVDNLECEVSFKTTRVHGRLDYFYCCDCHINSPKLELSTKKRLPWLNPKCERCKERKNRPAALLFKDGGPRPSFATPGKVPFFYDTRATFFVIGTSNMVEFGVSAIPTENSKVIEINVTDEPTTEVGKHVLSGEGGYFYFQGKQELILNKIQKCMESQNFVQFNSS
jgi:NAD-dependent deacetylase